MKGAVGITAVIIAIFLLIGGCSSGSSSHSHSSSSTYSSSYSGGWGHDGYDHILNDSDLDPWDGYGYDSPSVSESEGYIDKINGEWVFIH